MIENKIDLSVNRNMIIASVVLVVGIGGLFIQAGTFQLSGMALAAVIGIILNLVLPAEHRSA
ncbi:uracil permease, partial [Listeria monocytogenes]|nr:uracil permease [Listeria monocytogenes]